MEEWRDPRSWKQLFCDLLWNGFESGYPTAKDKRGYVHTLLCEGYPSSIVGWGDDYEDIVRQRGPPPATARYRLWQLILALLHAKHPLVRKGCYHPIVFIRVFSMLRRRSYNSND